MKYNDLFDLIFILACVIISMVGILFAIEIFIRVVHLLYPIVNISWGV